MGWGWTGPAKGWSTWNHFRASITSNLIREMADVLVSSGLREAGYKYVNIDDAWQSAERDPVNHSLVPDPIKFPEGMRVLADYVHSKSLLLGIYTSRGDHTCQGRPGSRGYEALDAQTFANWGIDYVKDDSCKDTHTDTFDDPTVAWGQYVAMRDGLNKTGRPIWLSITQRLEYNDSEWHGAMHCIHPPRPHGYPNNFEAFTTRAWVRQGRDVPGLANSYLVEYCNNMPTWGSTNAVPAPGSTKPVVGGFLSQLDSQQLLTYDNLTVPGAYNDNDMLECCNGQLTSGESRAQLTTFAMLSSPLILGHDLRNQSQECLDIIANTEVLALADATRAPLVYQYPTATWPNADKLPPEEDTNASIAVLVPGLRRHDPSLWSRSQKNEHGDRSDVVVNITLQVWAKPTRAFPSPVPSATSDTPVAVVVLNRGDVPASVNVTWAMIGLASTQAVKVRDLWTHADQPALAIGSLFVQDIPSHDVRALLLTPHSGPVL